MACASLATLILTATLLGHQTLSVEGIKPSATANTSCESSTLIAPEDANATLILRDAQGASLYISKIRVTRFRYYTNDERENQTAVGGVYPATSAIVSVKYPPTVATEKAVSAELKLDDRTFQQTAQIQKIAPPPTLKISKSLTLGLK